MLNPTALFPLHDRQEWRFVSDHGQEIADDEHYYP